VEAQPGHSLRDVIRSPVYPAPPGVPLPREIFEQPEPRRLPRVTGASPRLATRRTSGRTSRADRAHELPQAPRAWPGATGRPAPSSVSASPTWTSALTRERRRRPPPSVTGRERQLTDQARRPLSPAIATSHTSTSGRRPATAATASRAPLTVRGARAVLRDDPPPAPRACRHRRRRMRSCARPGARRLAADDAPHDRQIDGRRSRPLPRPGLLERTLPAERLHDEADRWPAPDRGGLAPARTRRRPAGKPLEDVAAGNRGRCRRPYRPR